jgi:hypothetical protein
MCAGFWWGILKVKGQVGRSSGSRTVGLVLSSREGKRLSSGKPSVDSFCYRQTRKQDAWIYLRLRYEPVTAFSL